MPPGRNAGFNAAGEMDLELLTIGVSCEIQSAANAAKRPAFVVVCARLLTIGVFGEMAS